METERQQPEKRLNKINRERKKAITSARVFLVEDEPTSIILTEAMLDQLGYQPAGVATSFETAMAALKVTQVDIVLVDLVLTGEKTGLDVIKELNRLNIPTILITGTVNETTLHKLADLDVYGFLPKPYDQPALATAIQLALKKFTRMQDKVFEEADAIKSRILATKALEDEFGVSEKLYLIKKRKHGSKALELSGSLYHRWVKICVTLSVAIGVLALVGYLFNVPWLVSYANYGATMKVNALLCIFLLSFSLWIENEVRLAPAWKVASSVSIVTVFAISFFSALPYAWPFNFGIDEFLFKDKFANEFNAPGRMAMTTALSFMFISLALIFNRLKFFRYAIVFTEGFGLLSIFLAMVGILGHIFKQTEFNQIVPYSAQARPTLLALIILTVGVFYLNPKLGIMSIFSNRRTSAKVGRKMLYWVNALMVAVSFSIYYYTPKSVFANLEVILILITTITILTSVILWATLKQIRNEQQAEQTVKFLENRERELQFVLKRVPNPVAVLDKNMRYVLASRKWIDDFNLKDKNIIGQSHYEIFPNLSDEVKILNQRAMNGEIIKTSFDNIADNNGRLINAKGEIRPWFDINNQVSGIIIFIESMTPSNASQ
ncbi:response regulator [Pseudobdellovibrio sp. HCB154]|uniref:response regulator n=1 Tax=Pseudobdellovibrio sp. HCB154 TaxID=3386277 RepID=UPI003916F09F